MLRVWWYQMLVFSEHEEMATSAAFVLLSLRLIWLVFGESEALTEAESETSCPDHVGEEALVTSDLVELETQRSWSTLSSLQQFRACSKIMCRCSLLML